MERIFHYIKADRVLELKGHGLKHAYIIRNYILFLRYL